MPGLPFRLEPGTGARQPQLRARGTISCSGRWSIGSNQVAWALDSTGKQLNDLEQLVWRVVSGLKKLVGGRPR